MKDGVRKLLDRHSFKLRIASNTAYQLVNRAVSALATFAVTVLIARTYGPEGYGDLTKVITYISFFYLLVDFGLNASFITRASREGQDDASLWRTLFGIRLVWGLALLFAALAITVFLPGSGPEGYGTYVKLGIILYAPTILLQGIITTGQAWYQRKLAYQWAFPGVIVGAGVSTLLVYGGIVLGVPGGYLWPVAAMAIGIGIHAAASLVTVRHLAVRPAPLFAGAAARQLIIHSIPLGFTMLLNLIYFRFDSVILTLTRTTAEVGLYGLAYKFFEFPLLIPTVFINTVFPLFADGAAGKLADGGARVIRASARTLGVLSIAVTGILVAAAPLLAYIDPAFRESVSVFRILAASIPFFYLSALTMWLFIARTMYRELVLTYLAGMSINMILNILLIPRYGMTAAAITTGVTEAVTLGISYLYLRRV